MCVCVSHSVTSGSLWATCVCDFRLCVGVGGRGGCSQCSVGLSMGDVCELSYLCVCVSVSQCSVGLSMGDVCE